MEFILWFVCWVICVQVVRFEICETLERVDVAALELKG